MNKYIRCRFVRSYRFAVKHIIHDRRLRLAFIGLYPAVHNISEYTFIPKRHRLIAFIFKNTAEAYNKVGHKDCINSPVGHGRIVAEVSALFDSLSAPLFMRNPTTIMDFAFGIMKRGSICLGAPSNLDIGAIPTRSPHVLCYLFNS